jgi:hypothetical protein
VPTWRVGIPVALLMILVVTGIGRGLHDFLSLNHPVPANVLVVEGWSPDYALEAARDEFQRGDYDLIIASGGPISQGYLVSGYETYADLGMAGLRKLGFSTNHVAAAPAEKTYRNRTYVSARSVDALLIRQPLDVRGINIVSVGTHARRSAAVYRKVLGHRCPVGVISIAPRDYDTDRWWTSSDGLKTTAVEGLGWLHEILFDSGR